MNRALAAVLVSFTALSCVVQTQPLEGASGPTGPQGETGPAGHDGETGAPGVSPFGYTPDMASIYYIGGNVGVGTATPGVGGDVARPLVHVKTATSASHPGLLLENDSGAGSYLFTGRSDAQPISDSTVLMNTAGKPILLNQTGGYVGIGTTVPETTLHVTMNEGEPQFALERTGSSPGKWSLGAQAAGFFIRDDTGVAAGAGIQRLRIDPSGRVALGSSAPAERLDLSDFEDYGSVNVGGIRFGNLNATSVDEGASHMYTLRTSGDHTGVLWEFITTSRTNGVSTDATTIAMRNGNVGVGTSSPTYKLQVIANSPDAAVSLSNTGGGPALSVGSAGMESEGSTYLAFDGAAKVGVGTSAPQATLDVNGTARLARYNSPPIVCDQAHDGTIALTSKHVICVCDGTAWVRGADGTTLCNTW